MESNSQKIFTNKAISIATFLGGPIAAGFLISKNYKVFGNEDAARNSVFIGIISTFFLFVGIFMIPEHIIDKIPQPVIPGIYTAIIAGLVEKLQGQKIKDFLLEDGQKASNWHAAGYGLIGLLIMIVFLVVMIFTIPTEGYEKNINIDKNVKLHYSKDIEDLKTERIASVIKQSGFMEGSEGAELFLNTEGNFYRLKFVLTDTSILSDTMLLSEFNGFENYLNYNLNLDKRIEIGFTDINLSNSFELQDLEPDNQQIYEPLLYLQRYHINDFQTIFYNSSMPIEDVKKVENTVKRLKAYFPINHRIDIVFLNTEPDYTIKFFVVKDLWQNTGVTNRLKSTVDHIQGNGIDKKIDLILIDNQTFEEIQL
ncbi:hypothetical protein [Sunxiuqinia elliptica]|uniref:Uncharacterized protein n=1 Tax=Sunxiuqinia elliptica TaxID=655355 RepID=A0A4R6GSV8_9BACT|nr:hypothetical protein [Sunxiuqinia elliptica]TDN97665.1 hypothetical protein DET52_10967 [Sunxiuqinia elliptica]TDO67020.1 hypothetical protein DET65_0388 [Sunxiuqinia elliptica]